MRTFLWITALATVAGASQAAVADPSIALPDSRAIASELASELQTGSLLFSQGDCLAIRIYTASRYTHVAIVTRTEDGPIVYDSMNGTGVRRLTLREYLDAERPHRLHVFHPSRPLTAEQGSGLGKYLATQLGRSYAIHHHLTGQRSEGLHCSEYATDALISIGILRANRPSKVSPASLVTGITRAGLYGAARTIELTPTVAPAEPAKNGCHRLWLDTKRCTLAVCDKLSGWFLCR